jgi:hypothetical protein
MRPPRNLSILDVTETASGVRVTWLDDDVDAVEQTADLEVWYEAADRSCGISAGYCVTGDAPDWVCEYVAERADAQACDAADYANELRAELRAEAGW